MDDLSSDDRYPEPFGSWRDDPTLIDLSGHGDDGVPRVLEPGTPALVSEVHLVGGDLVLSPTIRAAPEMTIRPDYQTVVEDGVKILFFTVTGDDYASFEDALLADDTIGEPTLVAEENTHRVYRARVAPATKAVTPTTAKLDIWLVDAKSADGGWLVRLRIPNRDALLRFRDHCGDENIQFHVRRLSTHSAGDEPFVGLTETQLNTLQTAFDAGYFDIPRGVSQTELAEMLDISTSALSQRLRNALGQLIEGTVADDDPTEDP
ncbi:helix-turn-helix domain-containing protein [Halorubellus litoreus]|uniref:Helix-turn-helix domain-containing protein n=1 Tax=Halorubellus litoreus TaxID=755308 RepID=A0ABD5VJB2_9EURY